MIENPGYDVLPSPPVPPENYCYELHDTGNSVTALRITIMGDSVFGTLQSKGARGTIIGTLYDSTILASFQPLGSSRAIDEEWKIRGDSIYMKTSSLIARDTAIKLKNQPDSFEVAFSPALYKVACK